MELRSRLNTTSISLPVTSRVNQSYLKCIYMVEKHAKIRGVSSLTINANMVGSIYCNDAAVFYNLITRKMQGKNDI